MTTVSVKMIPKGRKLAPAMWRFGPDGGRHRQLHRANSWSWDGLTPLYESSCFANERAMSGRRPTQKILAALMAAAIRDGLIACEVRR